MLRKFKAIEPSTYKGYLQAVGAEISVDDSVAGPYIKSPSWVEIPVAVESEAPASAPAPMTADASQAAPPAGEPMVPEVPFGADVQAPAADAPVEEASAEEDTPAELAVPGGTESIV